MEKVDRIMTNKLGLSHLFSLDAKKVFILLGLIKGVLNRPEQVTRGRLDFAK